MRNIFVLFAVLSFSLTLSAKTLKFKCTSPDPTDSVQVLVEGRLAKEPKPDDYWWKGNVHFRFERSVAPKGVFDVNPNLHFRSSDFGENYSLTYQSKDKDNPYNNGFDFDGSLSSFDTVMPSTIDIVVNRKDGGAPNKPSDPRVIPEIPRLLYDLENTNNKKFMGTYFAPMACQLSQ